MLDLMEKCGIIRDKNKTGKGQEESRKSAIQQEVPCQVILEPF